MDCRLRAIQKSLRPIIGSAASFLLSAFIIHIFALSLDPSFSLLLTRGIGKIALMLAAIVQAICFIAICPQNVFHAFWHHATAWPLRASNWQPFFRFFFSLACIHILFISSYLLSGQARFIPAALPLIIKRWPVLAIGFIGTFFLAWSEELLFRGLFFNHFARTLPTFASAVASSVIFSLLHDLANPLHLVSTQWQLGLGLFLLGMFLTYIRLWRGFAASTGAHAGLVYIKVILRKIPLLPITAGSPYLFPVDLRESLIVHTLLIMGILSIRALLQKQNP